MRRLPWLVMVVMVAAALVVGATDDGGPRTPEERLRSIAASVRCPTCAGQSVLESDASAAKGVRNEIARRIADGQSDQEIRAYLVSRFGERIVLTPPRSGVGGLVWVLPVLALVAALAGLVVAFRRWRTGDDDGPTDADRVLVARAQARTGREAPG